MPTACSYLLSSVPFLLLLGDTDGAMKLADELFTYSISVEKQLSVLAPRLVR